MALTRVTPNIIAVANNVTNKTVGNTTSIPSFTFDGAGVVTSASNVAISGAGITANTVANSAFQTGSVENYIASTGRPLTNRNIVINGAMQIAQRNTSVTGITTGNYRTADRWYFFVSSAGTWTMNVESSAPTNTEFRNSSNVICTTADSSLGSTDELAIIQNIEGFNCQGIKKGTASAESITVSFWVKSSNTGTFICELRDEDNTRQISKSYTINAANTWEKETITFPADITGQLDNDNGSSLRLFMWLAAGSNFTSGTLNSTAWASSVNTNRVVGQLNVANRVGNYFAITGVQLETGTVATPFEFEDVGTTLRKCQRYYYLVAKGNDTNIANGYYHGATQIRSAIIFPTLMRGVPTLVSPTGSTFYFMEKSGSSDFFDSFTIYQAQPYSAVIYNSSECSGSDGFAGNLVINGSVGYVAFSAEL